LNSFGGLGDEKLFTAKDAQKICKGR
jgi:hypothetical protein